MAGRKPNVRYANGHRRRQLRDWWKAQGLPCALCGQPIDYGLPHGNPMAFEVDEIVPVSLGGDPLSRSNTQPAHRICNERKGNGVRRGPKASTRSGAATHGSGAGLERSREWGF